MDEFDHRCSDKDCPYLGQSTRFASCKCKISREAMMLSAIEDMRRALDAALQANDHFRAAAKDHDRITRENEALRKALEEIKLRLSHFNNNAASPMAAREANANKAWHLAEAALALKEPGQ